MIVNSNFTLKPILTKEEVNTLQEASKLIADITAQAGDNKDFYQLIQIIGVSNDPIMTVENAKKVGLGLQFLAEQCQKQENN